MILKGTAMLREYRESDFCTIDQGYAYLMAKLTAFYGNRFLTNFQGIDPRMMKQTWVEILENHLTYKPKIDHVIKSLDPEGFITNPNQIYKLCNEIRIPIKPEATLTHQKTQAEIEATSKARDEAIAQLRAWNIKVGNPNV